MRILIVAAVASICLLSAACQSASKDPGVIKSNLMALDDPDNKYAGQYSELDQWIFEHSIAKEEKSVSLIDQKLASGEPITGADLRPQNWHEFMVPLDAQGCMTPLSMYLEAVNQSMSEGIDWDTSYTGEYIYAEGELSSELAIEADRLVGEFSAKYAPVVPRWLAVNPPEFAIFMPNGDIVTRGNLGKAAMFNSVTRRYELTEPEPNSFYRFNANGDLLGTTAMENGYLYLTRDELPVETTELQNIEWGYLQAVDASGSTLATYDYDGTPVNPADMQARNFYMCGMTPAFGLQYRYKYQQQPGQFHPFEHDLSLLQNEEF